MDLKEKSVYGNTLVYPNCETSKLFCELLAKKTFSNEDLSKIQKLGYKINIREI